MSLGPIVTTLLRDKCLETALLFDHVVVHAQTLGFETVQTHAGHALLYRKMVGGIQLEVFGFGMYVPPIKTLPPLVLRLSETATGIHLELLVMGVYPRWLIERMYVDAYADELIEILTTKQNASL